MTRKIRTLGDVVAERHLQEEREIYQEQQRREKAKYVVVMNVGQEDEQIVDYFRTYAGAVEETKWESSWDADIMKILPDGTFTTEF